MMKVFKLHKNFGKFFLFLIFNFFLMFFFCFVSGSKFYVLKMMRVYHFYWLEINVIWMINVKFHWVSVRRVQHNGVFHMLKHQLKLERMLIRYLVFVPFFLFLTVFFLLFVRVLFLFEVKLKKGFLLIGLYFYCTAYNIELLFGLNYFFFKTNNQQSCDIHAKSTEQFFF